MYDSRIYKAALNYKTKERINSESQGADKGSSEDMRNKRRFVVIVIVIIQQMH
jgi:hypothetical protein